MTVTAKDKAECAERELKQRARVYPRLVAAGKMTQAFADRQSEVMAAIAADYRAQVEPEPAKPVQERLL